MDNRPYWKCDVVMDECASETRAAMDNKAFRFDDRIWDAHYPPNGFNCRCMVKALTERGS